MDYVNVTLFVVGCWLLATSPLVVGCVLAFYDESQAHRLTVAEYRLTRLVAAEYRRTLPYCDR